MVAGGYPDDGESRVEVFITTDTSGAPPSKAGAGRLHVMFDAARPDAGRLYFTDAEWDAFVLGVRDGEFDLDEDGNLPPVPGQQRLGLAVSPAASASELAGERGHGAEYLRVAWGAG